MRRVVLPLCLSLVSGAAMAQTGLYTAAQAERGKALALDNCTSCHGGGLTGGEDSPPLAGSAFLDKWGAQPVGALFDFINTQMPLNAPGSLGPQGGADVTAYILSLNGQAPGDKELPPDDKALAGMTMTKP